MTWPVVYLLVFVALKKANANWIPLLISQFPSKRLPKT